MLNNIYICIYIYIAKYWEPFYIGKCGKKIDPKKVVLPIRVKKSLQHGIPFESWKVDGKSEINSLIHHNLGSFTDLIYNNII